MNSDPFGPGSRPSDEAASRLRHPASIPIADLIERLENATSGSKELSETVLWSLAPPGGNIFWRDVTQSIDAALTLVPENFDWHITSDLDGFGDGFYCACCHPPFVNGTWESETGATPALALCIAALNAILARRIETEGEDAPSAASGEA